MTNQPETKFIDNPHAPDVYADHVTGIFYSHGNVRLTLEVGRIDHVSSPGPLNRVVIGRLVLPLAAAESLKKLLNDYLTQISQPSNPPQATTPSTVH
jgi:hypothetical protein